MKAHHYQWDLVVNIMETKVCKLKLFTRVALKEDLPNYKLCRGDVATIIEHHLVKN